ncbi:hypothetical protein K435DRAFT_667563 [Dendrothele bispora CBS 962.96]|uniref:F-box domain-containing protein n=1 Tax=Dendrothele bispora (strain CBS 962.96) TaxID=1314807 RepID=A0A4S8LZE3_DENBC|nr:hypothetical protein K435DRAFT_667563 [Dendrothele bispora CBS 962.96]
MSLRPRLVDDLIPLILSASDHWWWRDLLRLARISPAWLFHIRKRLYTTPVLYSLRSCSLLARTLSENPSLCPLIKGVELCPISEGTFLTAADMQSVRYILGLEGLVSLTLGGVFSIGAERFLNSLSYPESIVTLHINGSVRKDALSCPASLEWDDVLASRFPSLQKLELSYLDLDITYPSFPYHLQLSELVLCDVQLVGGDLSHLLQETDNLKLLRVTGEFSTEMDEQVSFVVESYGVEFLLYEVECTSPWRPMVFDEELPPLASMLRVLDLNGVRVDAGTLDAVRRCYPNLEVLRVTGRTVSLGLEDWVEFVKSGGCTKLQRLQVPEGANEPPFKRWGDDNALRKVCDERGVILDNNNNMYNVII